MPPEDRSDRPYDLVLFGATGFTGGLTAEYLAGHAPDGCRWALAGRNQAKLEAVRDRLAAIDPKLAELPLLHADAGDPASLADVAGQTRVVVTTVGPYVEHGAGLVAACAEAGTDYADLTGEPEFIDTMYVRHHARAVETGARIVHACGFDSVPHDLGALFTVKQLPEGVPVAMKGMLRTNAAISGGTFASALGAFSRAGQMKKALAERRKVEPRPHVDAGRRVRTVAKRPHHDKDTGYWLVPLPTIDPFVVKRSAAALERYGPDFSYAHYAAAKRLPTVVGGIGAVGLLAAAAQVPPLRRQLLKRVPQGTGPSEEKRARSSFTMRFVAEGGGSTVRTSVSGGDPGYTETAKMLGESALCLAFDDNPPTAGQVTTAVAMGERLTDRLVAAGLRFEVL
ncbi:saccharopine dehydrogenase family protein [Nocardioides iriomotensis]|uniref:Saccharopine dehydrogenase n=1 Tax=Nocardioides iriomotensis TaxID=715784 RepID=A0A4Q5JA38_9ACTN|nr:saccharopine dehydrogenase NADP-binding domain-containing protein [Nocardioides iriomotensis]RYU15590.1 saccharopine dehydrogenase [Nocardioides iriomotensis]